MDRRALKVKISPFGIWPNQGVRITRFKFVRLFLEGLKIADTKIAGAGFKIIAERQRAERRVSTRADAVDHRSIRVCVVARREKLCAVYAIVNIDNPPFAIQSFAIFAAIATAASI